MHKIAVIPGDGIGSEVMSQSVKVLKVIGKKYEVDFELGEGIMGGGAYDKFGTCLPNSTYKLCEESDAILFGASGGPKWDVLPSEERPERALAILRKDLELFANLRPIKARKSLIGAMPFKPEIVGDGLDIITDTISVDVTDFINTSAGLTETTNNIEVKLDPNGGLEFNGTTGIRLEAAVAGGQITAETIKETLDSCEAEKKLKHKTLVLPGLAARLSGETEDATGWNVLVGPRDSGRIPGWMEENWPPKQVTE